MDDSILIIGAGPVGLSLAMALSKLGLKVEVFEQGEQLAKEIRASTFHAATLEKMEEWGVIEEVLAKGYRVNNLQFWDRQERKIVGDFHYSAIAQDTKYSFRLQCPQHVYADTLLDKLRSNPLVTLHFDHEFEKFRELPSGVEATFRTQGNSQSTSYRGRLICGADGANSAVRRMLNLSFEGMTYEDRFLLVGTDLRLDPYYPGIAPVSYIFDPEEWVITLQLEGLLRIVFQVKSDQASEQELEDANIRRRVWKFLGEETPFPILHKSIYRVHQRVAGTFRMGRCLLLGDAAHINNPASGMGMNSGILDAHCLAEKINEYLRFGRDQALDEYAELRRNFALENIRTYTKKRYQDMSAQDEVLRQQRNENYQAISQDQKRTRDFLLQASMLDSRI